MNSYGLYLIILTPFYHLELLIHSYFNIVKREMMDMVPKAISLTLVNYAKENLQRELLQELYKPEVLDDLLKESEFVVNRRKEVVSMVQALNKAEEYVHPYLYNYSMLIKLFSFLLAGLLLAYNLFLVLDLLFCVSDRCCYVLSFVIPLHPHVYMVRVYVLYNTLFISFIAASTVDAPFGCWHSLALSPRISTQRTTAFSGSEHGSSRTWNYFCDCGVDSMPPLQ